MVSGIFRMHDSPKALHFATPEAEFAWNTEAID